MQENSRLLMSLLTSEIHRNAGSMVDILEECWLFIIVLNLYQFVVYTHIAYYGGIVFYSSIDLLRNYERKSPYDGSE
jgi:hypothetical protein